MGTTLSITAPAKVNLFLEVGGVRPDGYHDVTTVLHALDLHDTVLITEGGPLAFSCSPDLGLPAEENLALRAAHAMAGLFARPLAVTIAIEKRIPAGAGLGGASADAAAVIVGLAHLWDIPGDDAALHDVARSLGADVPFFLTGGAALFTGRGDVLERRLPALDCPVVVVKPDEPVPTGAAYAAFDRLEMSAPASPGALLQALEDSDVAAVAAALHNNMTTASTGLVPAIASALLLVERSSGVLGSAMAGSGSSVFGICADMPSAERIADEARAAGYFAHATRLSPEGCVLTEG